MILINFFVFQDGRLQATIFKRGAWINKPLHSSLHNGGHWTNNGCKAKLFDTSYLPSKKLIWILCISGWQVFSHQRDFAIPKPTDDNAFWRHLLLPAHAPVWCQPRIPGRAPKNLSRNPNPGKRAKCVSDSSKPAPNSVHHGSNAIKH